MMGKCGAINQQVNTFDSDHDSSKDACQLHDDQLVRADGDITSLHLQTGDRSLHNKTPETEQNNKRR